MINLGDIQTVNFIIKVTMLIFSYGLVASVAGAFRAWLAGHFGDDTAADLGFLSLDPVCHVDIFGFLLFVFTGFGWTKYIPVNLDNIQGKHYKAKRVVASFGDTLAYIGIAVGMVLIFLIIFGYPLLDFALARGLPSHYDFTQRAPSLSSLSLMFVFAYVLIIYVCVLFGGISCVINFFHLIMTNILERLELHDMGIGFFLLRFILLYFLLIFMLGPLHSIVMAIISYSSKFFAYCLGVLT